MKKFDKISLKKKTDLAIKQRKQNEEDTKYVPVDESNFVSFLNTKEEEKTGTHVEGFFPYFTAASLKANSFEEIPPITISSFTDRNPWLQSDSEKIENIKLENEKKFADVHEEIAVLRRQNHNLKSLVLSQTELIVKLLDKISKVEKRTGDLSREFEEVLKEYGPDMAYMRNQIIQIRKESTNIQDEDKLR